MDLLGWLHTTPVALALRHSAWLYPAVEILHILGFCLLVGAVVLFDLRLLGLSPGIPAGLLARHLLPVAWLGFFLAAFSGFLLLLPEAHSVGRSPIFWAKITLIALAGLNAWAFHRRVGWRLAREPDAPLPAAARWAAWASLGLWTAVLVLGRLIAYFG